VAALAAAVGIFAATVPAQQPKPADGAASHTRPATTASLSDTIEQAFDAAYNLDHPDAIAFARKAVAMSPDEASAHRTLAAILWLNILFQRGAVTVDNYLGGVTKAQIALPKPPPEVEAEFKKELALAMSLSEARLKKNSKDVDARYDAGAAYALQASYTASVDGSLMAAFGSAKRAYNAHEEVLDKDPNRVDAGVVVGTYRYLVSVQSLPTRMFAYIAGFGGGKERGIGLLESAMSGTSRHMDAVVALVLIYSREGRHQDALKLLRKVETEYPRNRLLILEQGAAAIRAGFPEEAEATLTRGLAQYEADPRPKIPGERALWLYKRGLARLTLNHRAEALVDLRGVFDAQPVDWVRGRTHLELGKIADLSNDRPRALTEYGQAKSLCEASNDPLCANEAGRLQKRPFSFGAKTP
jgi:tetratricopeptide (TPR) repeat protein